MLCIYREKAFNKEDPVATTELACQVSKEGTVYQGHYSNLSQTVLMPKNPASTVVFLMLVMSYTAFARMLSLGDAITSTLLGSTRMAPTGS